MNAQITGSHELRRLFDDYFEDYLRLFPLEATASSDHRYDDQLADHLNEEHQAKQRALYTKYQHAIGRISRDRLSRTDKVHYDVFEWHVKARLEGLSYVDQHFGDVTPHLTPINHFWGLAITFAQLGSGKAFHPFNIVTDYWNFLSRVGGFEQWVETAIMRMREGLAVGVVQPRLMMEAVVSQIRALVTALPIESVFYQPILTLPEHFSEQDKEKLRSGYQIAISDHILPAYSKLLDFVETEYLPGCRDTFGMCHLPGGIECYDYLVRYWTTTDLTSDQVFETGMAEVDRIRTEIEAVKKEVGFTGSLDAFFGYLRTDPAFYPFTTEEEVLDSYRAIEARMQPFLPALFSLVPTSKLEIRATEAFRAASASEEYHAPAPDGSRPGVFYVPVPDPAAYHEIVTESIFLHEAVPGHHYQISIQQENSSLPRFMRFAWYGACGEGWALYAESLGKELGLYTNPYQYLGMLIQEMHRAVRLVVDTGIHAKGWSRQQAIEFSLRNEALSEDKITTEIDRYIVIPGQALSYKIGQLKILDLRGRAERALGGRFRLSEFHAQVIDNGVLPLQVLEKKIDDWIEASLGA